MAVITMYSLAVAPHISGFMSVLGSLWIVVDILRDRKKWHGSVYYRIMLGLSVTDIFGSFAKALGTWPIPVGTPDVVGASGNAATCTAQGFVQQIIVGSHVYNGCLGIYYLLVIRFGMKGKRLKRAELCMHVLCLSLSIITPIAGLPFALDLFHNAVLWCWIAPNPDENAPDNHYMFYRMAFWYVWVWVANLATMISMLLIYCHVRGRAQKSLKSSSSYVDRSHKSSDRSHKSSEYFGKRAQKAKSTVATRNASKVATQGLLYVCAFLLTTLPASVVRFMQMADASPPMWLFFVAALVVPLQGFWNCFIYMRPRCQAWKQKHPEWTTTMIVAEAFRKTLGCCAMQRDGNETEETDDYNRLETEDAADMTAKSAQSQVSKEGEVVRSSMDKEDEECDEEAGVSCYESKRTWVSATENPKIVQLAGNDTSIG